jgi:hypothetical protein
MTNCPYTAKDWRERADQARARAEQVVDPEARRAVLEIAAGYDRLAAAAASAHSDGSQPLSRSA